ncbi:MAG TPA: hypothetical protein H9881_16610 [Candidatus Stackebrandtia excrementipullorum]|nr:hypothetical protein [Candidatus Stackebrandtia excrementipullorum]
MRRAGLTTLGLAVLVGLLSGCSEAEELPPGEKLDAQVVMLENDPALPLPPPTISTRPVDAGLVAGWVAADSTADGDAEPRDPDGVALPDDEDGKSYVFVATGTRCLPAEGASLWRDGDALTVVPTVPDEDVNCDAPNHAHIQFAVDEELVAGVTTVNGEAIADPLGPAEPVAEIALGELFADRAALSAVDPVEIAGSGGGEPFMSALIAADGAENLDEVEKLLTDQVPDDMRRFAFLMRGCPGDESVLVVAPGVVSAERVGPGASGCPEAEQFVLTVFDVPADVMTTDTRPGLYGQ